MCGCTHHAKHYTTLHIQTSERAIEWSIEMLKFLNNPEGIEPRGFFRQEEICLISAAMKILKHRGRGGLADRRGLVDQVGSGDQKGLTEFSLKHLSDLESKYLSVLMSRDIPEEKKSCGKKYSLIDRLGDLNTFRFHTLMPDPSKLSPTKRVPWLPMNVHLTSISASRE